MAGSKLKNRFRGAVDKYKCVYYVKMQLFNKFQTFQTNSSTDFLLWAICGVYFNSMQTSILYDTARSSLPIRCFRPKSSGRVPGAWKISIHYSKFVSVLSFLYFEKFHFINHTNSNIPLICSEPDIVGMVEAVAGPSYSGHYCCPSS